MNDSGIIVIVGAGLAGGICAQALVDLHAEQQIVLIGDEVYEPYDRPPLSKEFLAGATDPAKLLLRPLGWYQSEGIALILGDPVEAIDRRRRMLRLASGGELVYHRLVFATGARPKRLDCIDAASIDSPAICYVRTIDDAVHLRSRLTVGARVAVIGAGLAGLEIAATATRQGCVVTVIEDTDQVLPRHVLPEVADRIAEQHLLRGVEILYDTWVAAVFADGDAVEIETQDRQVLLVDTLVIAIGTEPNVELAKSAGLAVDDGIITDPMGRTADQAILAIGQVASTEHPMLGYRLRADTTAMVREQAIAAAMTLVGQKPPPPDLPVITTEQYGISIQVVGVVGNTGQVIWRGNPAVGPAIAFILEDDSVTSAVCFNAGRELKMIRHLIVEGVAVSAAALADQGIKLADLIRRGR